MTETVRRHNEGNVSRHPKRMGRICIRGEESRKKIKAISCELSSISYVIINKL